MILEMDEDSSQTAEIDHLLGYYRIEGIYNDVFYYNQQTVRHNVFEDDATQSQHKFIPVLLRVYQVCTTKNLYILQLINT